MSKFLVLSVLLASQMSFAAPLREGKKMEEVRDTKAAVARDAKMDATRSATVDQSRANADIVFAEKLATNDTRPEAAKEAKSLMGIAKTAREGDQNAIAFLSEVRSEAKASNVGDVKALVEKTAEKRGLDKKAIDEACGG